MTLRQLYDAIEQVARLVPNIRSIVENDMLRLNERRDVAYCVFGIQQESHTTYEDKMVSNLNLYFVDRLVNSGENEVEIQSHAIEVLRAIVKKVVEDDIAEVERATFFPFTYRFQDLCAGAWLNASFIVPLSDCNEIFIEEENNRN